MDAHMVNYDGRSVYDMLKSLDTGEGGDAQSIRTLQSEMAIAQSNIDDLELAVSDLETDKQDADSYVFSKGGPGYTSFSFDTSYLMSMKRGAGGAIYNGISFMGTYDQPDENGISREWFRWERHSNKIQGYIWNGSWNQVSSWSADYDSGNVAISGEYMDFTVRRIGNTVWVVYAGGLKQQIPPSQASQTDIVLANLPVGFRPLNNSGTVVLNNAADKQGLCLILANGNIYIRSETGFSNETVLVNSVFLTSDAIPTT